MSKTATAEKPMTAMTVAELRELARERGLSTTTKLNRKAELIAAIEKAAEAPAVTVTPEAPAKPAKNRCTVCGVRGIGTGPGDDRDSARSLKMCNPCATEGGWENTHDDHGHDAILQKLADKKRLTAAQKAEQPITEHCWICHPELNAAKAEVAVKDGTSREGMVVHAQGGIEGKVACLKTAGEAAGGTVEVTEATTGRGKERAVISTTLRWRSPVGVELTVVWDARGRFQYGPSVVATGEQPRKIRNVSEALRVIAQPA